MTEIRSVPLTLGLRVIKWNTLVLSLHDSLIWEDGCNKAAKRLFQIPAVCLNQADTQRTFISEQLGMKSADIAHVIILHLSWHRGDALWQESRNTLVKEAAEPRTRCCALNAVAFVFVFKAAAKFHSLWGSRQGFRPWTGGFRFESIEFCLKWKQKFVLLPILSLRDGWRLVLCQHSLAESSAKKTTTQNCPSKLTPRNKLLWTCN